MVTNQAMTFLAFIILGIIIGFLFDIFRISRKTFNTPDIITYIEDVVFWLLTGFLILSAVFTFNDGEIRLYMFLAIILGCLVYMLLLSKLVITISTKIIRKVIKIFKKVISIISKPIIFIVQLFKKIFFKPISFIIINFKKTFRNVKNSIKRIFKVSQHKKTFNTKKT